MMFRRILLSLALMAGALGLAHAVTVNGVNNSSQNLIVGVGYLKVSVTDSITAAVGGGQTNAVLLTSSYNRVATVASAADSVKLPPCTAGGSPEVPTVATPGMVVYVTNAAAANSMNLYPSSGGSINALVADATYAVAANKTVAFLCSPGGTIWYSLLGG